jgi:hypothetical protein
MSDTSDVQFMNRAKFSKMVEDVAHSNKISYIDAIIEVCNMTKIDPEDVKKYISPIIKQKLEVEAMDLNYLPKQNTLIFD